MMLIVFGVIVIAILAVGIAIGVIVTNRIRETANRESQTNSQQLINSRNQVIENIIATSVDLPLDNIHKKKVKFYASAPALSVEIPSEKAFLMTFDQICRYIDYLYSNNSENFFVLEDDQGNVVQFFGDGISAVTEIDVPRPSQGGSFVGQFYNKTDVKFCVQCFFENVDIVFDYPLKFESYTSK